MPIVTVYWIKGFGAYLEDITSQENSVITNLVHDNTLDINIKNKYIHSSTT